MERIYEFLPSVLIIGGIAGVTLLYVKWAIRRFGDKIKSVEWQKENQLKVSLTVGTPMVNIYAPTIEELIFRAPLIIAFGTMSTEAWYAIFASSLLFALMHWFGKKIGPLDIFAAKGDGSHISDDVTAEVNRLHAEKRGEVMVRKALHVVNTFPLGVLAGYYGITYQSIWVAVGIHFAWNLIMPVVLLVFLLLLKIVFYYVPSLVEILWYRVKYRPRK